jgi:general secretion pathway protein L
MSGHASRSRSWRAEPWKPIAIAAALLLLGGIAGIGWYYDVKVRSLEGKLLVTRDIGRRSEELHKAIEAASAAAVFIPERQSTPRAIEVVDALSRLVPDDSWIFDLEITQQGVRMAGFSADVPGLIQRLQQSPLVEEPQLRSPVIHGPGKSGDRFEVAVKVRREVP